MIKQIFNYFFALSGLVLLSPLFVILGILIKCESSGPIFFRQERIGQHFKPFLIFKFRTMANEPQEATFKLATPGDERITRIGAILRKSKIDELPQLFNILKGEMSVVGPRPEMKIFVDHYKKEFADILKVQPGLTDLASIEFKDEEALHSNPETAREYYVNQIMPKKIKLAREYVQHHSLAGDVQIIVRTIVKLIK